MEIDFTEKNLGKFGKNNVMTIQLAPTYNEKKRVVQRIFFSQFSAQFVEKLFKNLVEISAH